MRKYISSLVFLVLLTVCCPELLNASTLNDDTEDDLSLERSSPEIVYVLKLAEKGTPEQLREALNAGYNFNVHGHIYDDDDESYYVFDDETPLHRAAYYNNNPESIRFLISQGLDLNEAASCGNTISETPLSLAIRQRNMAAFDELLKAGADPDDYADDYNASLFHIVASSYRNYNDAKLVIDALVKAGGDVNQHYAFTPEEARELKEYEDPSGFKIQWTPEDPIDDAIFSLSHAGRGNFMSSFTPLMFAVLYDNADVLNILLDYGADANIRSLENKTALDYAKFLPKKSKIKSSSAFKRLRSASKSHK